MSNNNIAPWLQGLDGGWEAPAHIKTANVSSASHDASALRQSANRNPRRSLSGLPSSISTKRADSTQKRRPPLAQLNSNDTNTLSHANDSVRIAGTRSVSAASDGSTFACGTVQQRSKSASPSKTQETMEWKRRLVNGNVGYGDQTDLFGANGLENIFARTHVEKEQPKPKNGMSWLPKSDAPMPSSPPPWPSSIPPQRQQSAAYDFAHQEMSSGERSMEQQHSDGSFRSNPFDLESTEDSGGNQKSDDSEQQDNLSRPNKAFVEVAQDTGAGNRTVSGQTELSQEDFSPVFISKTKTLNGFDYAALDSHVVKQFNSKKVSLRHPSQEQSEDGSGQEPPAPGIVEHSFTDGPESESLPTVPDISFSENLPTGSPFPNLGKNVQTRRGGYSNHGSFKQRPLSPSQSTVEPSLNPSASGLLSPVPSEKEPSPAPRSPSNRPITPKQHSEAKSRSSGSPLKLFGAHDTFTNNRLLRRLSQLNPDGTVKLNAISESSPRTAQREQSRHVSNGSSFGRGELDDHGFSAEITITSASDSSNSGSENSPGSEVPVPGSKAPFGFRFEESLPVADTFKMKRKLSKHSAATSRGSTIEKQRTASKDRIAPATDSKVYTEGKRPPTSPFKSPTPKRRRTLHESELDGIADMNFDYHSQLQEAVSSRKRRDARPGDVQIEAEPDILAQRKILRPRNPTPSQRRRQQIEAELRQAAEDFADHEPEKLGAVMEQIESSTASEEPQTLKQQAETLASEVAAFTLNVQKPSGEHEGERKRSVTTQDFLDEALMVMNLIRAKARPQSNLGSVEESDAEALGQSIQGEESEGDQSHLRVSRPPSREGSGWRTRNSPQTSARVISHLKRFQERDEQDDTGFIANTMASLQADDDDHMNDQVVAVDENSNIRITGPSQQYAPDTDSATDSHRSNGSATNAYSTDNSTGRTIGTSSTRKSDNVGTLAPYAVAHLIGEQVGGMTFDRERQRWVRVSRSPPKQHGSFLELPSNVTSDDDPFREISDLPVDEQKELRRISSPGKPEDAGKAERKTSSHDQAVQHEAQQPTVESRASSTETVIPRPVTRDSSQIHHAHSSSVPSRWTGFASSQQEKIETRATSWSDEELAKMSAIGKQKQNLAQQMRNLPTVQEPQLEESGNGTDVTFPSPPNQRIPTDIRKFDRRDSELDMYEEDLDKLSGLREDTALNVNESNIQDINSPKLRQTPSKQPPNSIWRGAARQMSLRRQTLTNRFATAEAHESSELSLIAPLPGDRMMSLSLSVSRPVSTRLHHQPITDLQSSPSKGAPTGASFLWSDLPDFTVHEDDAEQRPSEKYLATRLAQHAAAEVNDRYALAVKDLVKILTDVNEDEPFWEDLKSLNLNGRSLVSLYGLDDFCTRVQEMDVSHNALTHLDGAPMTTRRLNARGNQLSGLTSWYHLQNLQVLDISDNRLESLDGLAGLMHLRELRADDNEVASLDGIAQLDGLMKVSMRRNRVRKVDFAVCGFESLTHLDLSGNGDLEIEGLSELKALMELRLDGCKLKNGLSTDREMPKLTTLSVRDCGLTHLDVTNLPGLQHLLLDDNMLATVTGLPTLKHLQTLSVKRQTLPSGQTSTLLTQPFETTTLNLCGTPLLPNLALPASYLSIRHLDLASCGLHALPEDFGLKFPNLRSLNLNFNSLRDVRPLLNLQKLESVSLCGNKIVRLRKSVAVFGKLPALNGVDLRDTPLTSGLYPNMALTLSRHTSLIPKPQPASDDADADDEDAHTDRLEQARYLLPHSSSEMDAQHQASMDDDSRLRRRVYELLMGNACKGLRELDGLVFEGGKVGRRDGVWKRLVELGVVKRSERSELVG